eukprot:PhF_6_TR34593/c0_g1_i1/m.50377
MSLAEVTTTPAGVLVSASNIRDDSAGETKIIAEFDRPSEYVVVVKALVTWKDETDGARIVVDGCFFNVFLNNAPQKMQTAIASEPVRNGMPEKVTVRYIVGSDLRIEELKIMFVTSWGEYESSEFGKRMKSIEDGAGDIPCPMCNTVALKPFASDFWSCGWCGNYGAGECKSCPTCSMNVCKTCSFQIAQSQAQSGATQFREVSVAAIEAEQQQAEKPKKSEEEIEIEELA